MQLLPPRYVRPYAKRNKTDAAAAAALLEAVRCADMVPVRIKSVEQQCLQSLHRMRSQWLATRTARINGMRGCCREFGISLSEGARVGLEQIGRLLADRQSAIPALVRPMLQTTLEEVRLLEQRISELERQLSDAAAQSPACQQLLSIPGVGLMTAATGGAVNHFKDARHFASWFGLTPKEQSTGGNRHLGRISKRGDRSIRCAAARQLRSRTLTIFHFTLTTTCQDIDRPSWPHGLHPPRYTPLTTLAARLPLAKIGASWLQTPFRYGLNAAHFRCRIYDCKLPFG